MHSRPRPRCHPRASGSGLVALFAASLGCGGAAPAGSPALEPAGSPRDLDPVLARAKEVSGGGTWDRVTALSAGGTIEMGGLRGPTRWTEELTTGRTVSRFTLGPMSQASGYDGARSWIQTAGGEVNLGGGPAARVAAANEAWLAARGYWFPGRRGGRVARAVDREDGFQVVRATPEGGRALDLWFDAATGLLDRIVDDDGAIVTTTRFADYRPVDGLRLPFEVRVSRGEARYDAVVRVARYRVNPPVAASDFAAPRASFGDVEFAAGAHETTLPFELLNNHIYVRAEIDGRPVRLLVDTGGINIVTPAAAAALGLRSEGALEVRGVGAETQDLGLTRAASLRLGDVTIRKPLFFVVDLSPLSPVEGVELAGLVGHEVFHRFAVRLDYASGTITLIDPRHFDPKAARGTAVPFTWHGHTPVVAGEFDGIPGQFTIDTGSRTSLTLHAGFTAQHQLVAKYRASSRRVTGWGVGGPVRTYPVRAGDVAIGGAHVRDVAADLFTDEKGAFADKYHAGNIGGGILRRFTITFDYARTQMFLEPNKDFAAPDPFDRSGMWFNAKGRGYEVVDVVEGGPAARAGLAPGDLLLELGGAPAGFDDLPRARSRLRNQPAGTRVALVYERQGARKTATLILADAIPLRASAHAEPGGRR